MIVAGTGHRPEQCEDEGVVRLKASIKLRDTEGVETFISGMAAGFDLWAADEAIDLGIPVIAARPWAGHKPRNGDEELYQKVLDNAIEIVDVMDAERYPGPQVYDLRNQWMVDNATHLMAYWSGVEKGGTWNCVQYARDQDHIKIANIYWDPPF